MCSAGHSARRKKTINEFPLRVSEASRYAVAEGGDLMSGRTQGTQRWRRLTAGLLVAALLLQGLGFAFASAALAAGHADSTDWAGFELCRHDQATPDQPGAPDQPAADAHCVFCVAGPGFVLEPPALSVLFLPVEIEVVSMATRGGLALGPGDRRCQLAATRSSGRGVTPAAVSRRSLPQRKLSHAGLRRTSLTNR